MGFLKEYERKRRFDRTPEPAGGRAATGGNRFVVQKHDATRLHYDFRLEIDGALKSWAVPKGPSLNPADKRLAVQTEDHPLDYAGFEGVIPDGNYGAGPVMVWDNGTFEMEGELPASKQVERGELKFSLRGRKLRGSFALVKLRSRSHGDKPSKGNEWLLIKHKDAAVDAGWNVDAHDGSVLTGRTLAEIAEGLPAAVGSTESMPSPALVEGVRKAAMPSRVQPMLATLVDKPFSRPGWIFEVKLDGERALAWIAQGKLELRSRTARVITEQYPELAGLPERLRASEAVVDGEIVVLDERGRSDFERLQSRMHVARPTTALVHEHPAIYYLFDILYCDGYDLRQAPLIERKDLLRQVLDAGDPFRYCDHVAEKGTELFALAREKELEGIIGKQTRSVYVSARSPQWVKFKAVNELDAVVGGWTEPRGSREHFGALLAGLYDGNALKFIGGLGTGFDQKKQKAVFAELEKLAVTRCPFETVPDTKEKSYWVQPKLVARVRYGNWTNERRLRAPVFVSLLDGRDPKDCRFESQAPESAPPSRAGMRGGENSGGRRRTLRIVAGAAMAGRALATEEAIEKELFQGRAENVTIELDGKPLRLSNLNKVYFPESGYTKRQLLAYYYRMAKYVLPFLEDRPLVLRRYPDGIRGEAFFQKDAGESAPEWMETVAVESEGKRKRIRYFVANSRAALLYLTNLGCIDHNPWSSRRDDLDHPDYVFFDLDPSEGTKFAVVVGVARAVLQKLQELKLDVFLKTSGATGFHLWLPLERLYTYEQVRTFAEIVGRLVGRDLPKLVTQERIVEKRLRGTVLIDASQNGLGRPLAAPYAVRAFPHAPVSAPVDPNELRPSLLPERLNMKTMLERIRKQADLWAGFWKQRQRLEKAVEQLTEKARR